MVRHREDALHLTVPLDVPDVQGVEGVGAVSDLEQRVGAIDDDTVVTVHESSVAVDVEDVLGNETVEEAEVRQCYVTVGGDVEAVLRFEIEDLTVEDGVQRRRRHFRYDVLHVPREALALEVSLHHLPLVERFLLVVREVGVLRRPVVRGSEEELLPVVHPQLRQSHLVLLNDLLAVSIKLIGERLEGVRHTGTRMVKHL